MTKSICFTGHRVIARPVLPGVLRELQRVLETAIPRGFVDFYTGGAIGWDTYCAQMVLDLREEYPGIALHLVLPAPGRSRQPGGQSGSAPPMTASAGRQTPVNLLRNPIPETACACGISGL